MKKLLPFIGVTICLLLAVLSGRAQFNQTVKSGDITAPFNFPVADCTYTWVNNTPGIGLPASGELNVPAFTAVNTGATPVTATITITSLAWGIAYIPNLGDNTVSVVNELTNDLISIIPVGLSPNYVTVSPDDSRVYIVNSFSPSISVISTASNKVIATIPTVSPNQIALTTDGAKLYVTNSLNNTVEVYDTSTYALLLTIPVGNGPGGMVMSPDGLHVYVTDINDNAISVIDTKTNVVTNTISVGNHPDGITIGPDNKNVYVTNFFDNTVSVISTVSNAVTATVSAGVNPDEICITPDGGTVYVCDFGSAEVTAINTATNTVISTTPVGANPSGICVNPNGSNLMVTSQSANNVSVINTATNKVQSTFKVGNTPTAVGNFMTHGTGCGNVPATFTITVNPASALPPAITAGSATGNISACSGSPSQSPDISQFSVSGNNLTADIIANAPPGFEVSLNAGSGYANQVTLAQSGGSVPNTTVYVRWSGQAASGGVSGNVLLTSTGAVSQNVAITGTVNALPTMTKPVSQTLASGAMTTAVNFTGTGNTFNWVNDTPGIGLAANGSGNIGSFTAINTSSSAVTATITVTPVIASFAYISNLGSNTVSIINTLTNTVAATIPVGMAPGGLSVSPDGSTVYVANENSNTVSVIDTKTNAITGTISGNLFPYGVLVSRDGHNVYITNDKSNQLSIISTATNSVTATIPTGKTPGGIAVSLDGNTIYVANNGDNDISVINEITNTAGTTIAVGLNPGGLALSPDGSRLYVVNFGDGTVSVINTSTNAVITTVKVGLAPFGITVSPDGGMVYVANGQSNNVSVISTQTNAVVATIPAGVSPFGISVSPDGNHVYVGNEGAGTVSVINTATNTVEATVPVGISPDAFGNFVTGGANCDGVPVTFTITVNPTPIAAITAGPATGNITACEGSASASPDVQKITVSGSGLTGDITATAPAGGAFELSLNPGTGFGNMVTLAQSAGNVTKAIIYVRSASTAPAGNISGNVTLSSAGATDQLVAVAGAVNALPVINPVGNQLVLNGDATAAIDFTGTGSAITWVNDKPGIGLPASGAGNIASFKAINTGTAPVTATITATPVPSGFAYITNSGDGTVTAINTVTHVAAATIPVGGGAFGISVSPDGSRVYVTNDDSNTVSVISTSTNTVIATITVNANPLGLAATPDGSLVFVTYGEDGTVISAINTLTNTVTDIPVGYYDYGIAVTPDGSKVYMANNIAKTVSVFNTATNTSANVTTITAGSGTYGVAISPDNKWLYVTNSGSSTVSVIDIATDNIVTFINVGDGPNGVAVSPDGSRVYVTNLTSNTLSVINAANNTVITTVATGTAPFGVSVSPDGKEVYVANYGSNNVSVISTASNKEIATVPVGLNPKSFGNFVKASSGCTGAPVTFTITVNPTNTTVTPVTGPITIPNTFTPNGDGVNDTWNIKNLAAYPNCSVQIFNRWGQNVYSSTGYPIPWAGNCNGVQLPTGTYYYVIDLKDGTKISSGYVAIVR